MSPFSRTHRGLYLMLGVVARLSDLNLIKPWVINIHIYYDKYITNPLCFIKYNRSPIYFWNQVKTMHPLHKVHKINTSRPSTHVSPPKTSVDFSLVFRVCTASKFCFVPYLFKITFTLQGTLTKYTLLQCSTITLAGTHNTSLQ